MFAGEDVDDTSDAADWRPDSLRTRLGRITRKQILLVALALAFFIPIAVGLALDIQYNQENPLSERSWYWDFTLESTTLVKHYPEPIAYFTSQTMLESEMDRSFWFYESPTYSRTLKSANGGPITFEAGDNPFADQGSPNQNYFSRVVDVEPADTFTFGDVYDNLSWFATNWRPLQWIANRLSSFDPSRSAAAANRYLVLDDAGCTVTAIATDTGCWSTSSGGSSGASVPADGDVFIADTDYTAATGTLDADMRIDSLSFTAAFVDTIDMSTFDLIIDGDATLVAGQLNKNTGSLQVRTLTISGGNLISTSGNVIVYGAVNVSAAASYIDFGSETWTIYGEWTNSSTSASWDAGTGTAYFGYQGYSSFSSPSWLSVGCQLYWDMETLDGSDIDDQCSTNDGVITGAVDAAGRIGQGRDYDGTDDSVQDTTADFMEDNTGTVSFWFSADDLTTNRDPITWSTNGSSDDEMRIAFRGDLAGDPFNFIFSQNGSIVWAANGPGSLVTDSSWHHVALTSDASTFRYFFDGIEQTVTTTLGSNTGQWFNDATDADTFTAGGLQRADLLVDWDGDIDEVYVHDRVLTNAEIRYLALVGQEGLVLNYDMETTTGGLMNDFSLNEFNGTISNTTDIAGEVGRGRDFDGTATDNDITIGDLDLTLPFSLAAWINLDASGGDAPLSIVAKDASGTSAYQFAIQDDTDNELQFAFVASAAFRTAVSTDAVTDLTWTHVAYVIEDGGSGSTDVTFYINGTVDSGGTVNIATYQPSSDNSNATVGGIFNNARNFNGGIDELFIFDRAITASEIDALALGKDVTFANFSVDEDEFNNVTFEVSDYTMATNALEGVGGTLTISNPSGVQSRTTTLATSDLTLNDVGAIVIGTGGVLTANASTVTATSVTMTGGTSGVITVTSGAWTVSGNWDTSGAGSTYTQGTGIVTFDATATITLLSTDIVFDDLTISGGTATMASAVTVTNTLTLTATLATADLALTATALIVNTAGVLTANASTVDLATVTMTGGTSGVITVTTGSWTVSGSWDSSGAGSTFTQGTGAVDFDASATITLLSTDDDFYDLTISGGTATAASSIDVFNDMVISGGTFAKGTQTLDITGALTMSGGDFTSTSGDVTVGGLVNISSASSAIDFGSETWTVSGTWTNASTDTAVWEAGGGTVLFDSATGGTMTFAGANMAESEFNNITFTSSAGTAQTFTMATRALRWGGTLTVSDGTSTTALATADLGLTTAALVIGNGGILTANASTVAVTSVTMTGGTSGILTLSSGAWTVSGNWDTSGASSAFTQGASSTVDFNVSTTITMLSTNDEFRNLTISAGTATAASSIDVLGNMVVSGGTFAKGTQTLDVTGSLTLSGGDFTSTSGNVTTGLVNISSASSAIDFGSENWTVSGTWTNVSTDGTVWEAGSGTITFDSATGGTMTFAPAGLGEDEFNNVTITSSAGTAQIFTMATNALRVAGAFTVSDVSSTTELDTANLNITMLGAMTVGAGGILDAGSSTITVGGDWTSGSGTWEFDTSTVVFTGTATPSTTWFNLTIDGGSVTLTENSQVDNNLTILNGGFLDTVSYTFTVSETVDVQDATSYIIFGSSTWTVNGTWTNATTSASWSAGTSSITFSDATAGTMTFAGANLSEAEFNNVTFDSTGTTQTFTMATRALRWGGTLTVSDAGSTTTLATADLGLSTAALVIGNGGILTANASTVAVTSVTMTGGTSGILTLTSGSWTVSGNWDTSGAGSTYTQATSTTEFDASATITLLSSDDEFNNVTISAGTATMASSVNVQGNMIISGGTFAKGTQTLIVGGSLTMSGGDFTSTSGSVTITNAVNISSAASAISFGSETWTLSSNWTNASTDTAVWDAGSGTMLFDGDEGATITPAGANLSESEFNNVTFTSSAGTAQTFTMATRALRWGGTLTVSDGSSTTALATADLGLSTAALVIGDGGILTANASTVSATSVTMTGGTSGVLTITSGSWTVSGNWDTSGASSTFTQGTSEVDFDATATVTMLSTDDDFYDLTISNGGTITMASSVDVLNNMVISGGTFAKSTQTLDITGSLTMSGGDLTSTSGDVTIGGLVNISSASSAIDFGSETWTVSGTWTNASTDTTVWEAGSGTVLFDSATGGTMTFAGANLSESEFNNITFDSTGTTQTFTMATRALRWGGTLTVSDSGSTTTLATADLGLSTAALAIGNGGILTANASTVAVTSVTMTGGTTGVLTLTSGTWTVSGNWDTSGASSTFTQGASSTVDFAASATITMLSGDDDFFNLTISGGTATAASSIDVLGAMVISGGTFAKGTQTLDVTGALTMSGGDLTSTSGNVTVGGDVNISSASSAIDFGSESWTLSGDYDNSSTDSVVWEAGSGTVTFDSSTAEGFTFGNLGENEFFNLTFNSTSTSLRVHTMSTNALVFGGTLTITDTSGGTILNSQAQDITGGNLTISGSVNAGLQSTGTGAAWVFVTVNISTATGLLDFGAANTMTVSGLYTNSSTNSLWDAGTTTSGITFTSTTAEAFIFAGTNLSEDEFLDVTFNSSSGSLVVYTLSTRGLRYGDLLTITDTSGGTILNTQSQDLTGGDLTISGSVNAGLQSSGTGATWGLGTVNISTATGLLDFGTDTGLTVSGTYTNATTNALWDAGTGTSGVTFTSATGATLTFAGANLSEDEFLDVTFTSSAGTAQVFTMATRGLQIGDLLTITDSSSTTELDTAGLAVMAAIMAMDNAGAILDAGASTITVSGNWASVAGDFQGDTSTVVLSGTGSVDGETFYNLTISGGTRTPSANLAVSNDMVISGGTYAKGTTTLTISNDLTMSGGDLTSTSGTGSVTGNVNISSAASAIAFGSESWTVGGSWTNASTDTAVWDNGSGTMTFSSSSNQNMTFAGSNLGTDPEFRTVQFTNGAATFTMQTRGLIAFQVSAQTATLDTGADLSIDACHVQTSGGGGTLNFNGSTVTLVNIAPTCDISFTIAAGGTLNAGTSSVVGNASGQSLDLTLAGTGALYDLTTNHFGTAYSNITVSNNMVISGSWFDLDTLGTRYDLSVTGNLTMSASGDLLWNGGGSGTPTVTIGGNVNLDNTGSYIEWQNSTWTVSGTWSNSTNDPTWSIGTSSILFDSATGGTMTFAGALSEAEFNDVTFTSSAGTAQTFTMATSALRWAGTLTVSDGASTTALATADLSLGLAADTPALVIGDGGILTANASTVIVSSVTMTSGTSGTLTLTSGPWTVSGAWNTSGAGSTFTQGTSLVTFDATTTITMLSTDIAFGNLTITTGTATGATNLTVDAAMIISGGTFEFSGNNDLTVTGLLTLSGGNIDFASETSASDIDINGGVTISSAGSAITFGGTTWTVAGAWTNASTSGSWSVGTSSIEFDDASAQTIGGTGTNNIWNTVILSGGAKSFTSSFTTASFSSITAARTMTITDTVTWTIAGGTTVAGASGAVLTIVSSTPDTQWDWTVSSAGQVTITFADIRDANATSVTAATAARFDATATSNTDSENNTYVEFNGSPVNVVRNVRWYEDPDSYYWAGTVTGQPAVTQWEIVTTSGYFGTTINIQGSANSEALVCSAVAGAGVTFTVGGLANGAEYFLDRDGGEVARALSDAGGVWTDTVTAGWALCSATPNTLVLNRATTTGGGGGARIVVDFTHAVIGGSIGASVSFTDNTFSTNELVGWAWEFGDGGVGSGQSTIHLFRVDGTYAVTLTVTDVNGQTGSVTKNLILVGLQEKTILTWWAQNAWAIIAILFVIALITKRKKVAWATVSLTVTWGILRFVPGLLDYLTFALGFLAGIPVPPDIPLPAWPF